MDTQRYEQRSMSRPTFGAIIIVILLIIAFILFALVYRMRRDHAQNRTNRRSIQRQLRELEAMSRSRHILEDSIREGVRNLPTHAFTINMERSSAAAPSECEICFEVHMNGQIMRTLSCGHWFHRDCIDRWLIDEQTHKLRSCPLCKRDPLALALDGASDEAPCEQEPTDKETIDAEAGAGLASQALRVADVEPRAGFACQTSTVDAVAEESSGVSRSLDTARSERSCPAAFSGLALDAI
jgi:hypothetical protein